MIGTKMTTEHLTANERLIAERCTKFMQICAIGALLDEAPRYVLLCIAQCLQLHNTEQEAPLELVRPILSALDGFARGSGYQAHFHKYVEDYLASVLALSHLVIDSELAQEVKEDVNMKRKGQKLQ